jgi:hypothetical protein
MVTETSKPTTLQPRSHVFFIKPYIIINFKKKKTEIWVNFISILFLSERKATLFLYPNNAFSLKDYEYQNSIITTQNYTIQYPNHGSINVNKA